MNAIAPPSLFKIDDEADLGELIVDSFAGGGGASEGIEMALGRSPDFAINHDAEALALHRANHPATTHLSKNIYKVDPLDVVGQRSRVGLLWASPDCKDFSKAKGGTPVRREIRDLAWTVVLWIERVRPRVIILENVEEFQQWGPIIPDGKGGWKPDPERRGETFREWVAAIKKEGYAIEWRELRACDYGAPTTRKRLFVIARRDHLPIVWPAPTHGDPASAAVLAGELQPYRTAASHVIDWSIPCPSIFDTAAEIWEKFGIRAIRPLAKNTMARIAKGVKRYVIEATRPFIVNLTHGVRTEPVDQPVNTVTGAHRGEKSIIVPHMTKFHSGSVGADVNEPVPSVTANSTTGKPGGAAPIGIVSPILTGVGGRAGQSRPRSGDEPTATTTSKADTVVVAPYLVPRYGERDGQDPRTLPVDQPSPTVVPGANGGSLVTPVMVSVAHGDSGGRREYPVEEPARAVTADGVAEALVAPILSSAQQGGSHRRADEPHRTVTASSKDQNQVIAAHLEAYYGPGTGSDDRSSPADEPTRTVVTENRHSVVAAHMQRQFGNSVGHGADEPTGAVMPGGGGKEAMVAAFLAQHNTDMVGHPVDRPMSTIVQKGPTQAVVSAGMMNLKGSDRRMSSADDPTPAITSQGNHVAEVRAFLMKYFGTDQDPKLAEPLHTVTTKDRFGLVTVEGEEYQIVDIGMRMLTPRELFKAQGFRADYEIEHGVFEDGSRRKLSKTAQVRMCGNSVCPPIAAALVSANCNDLATASRIAAE